MSRLNTGFAIASGLSIGMLLTLFVVPAVYLLIAADHYHQAKQGASGAAPPSDAMATA